MKAAMKKPIGKMSKEEFVDIDRSRKLRDAVKFEEKKTMTKGKLEPRPGNALQQNLRLQNYSGSKDKLQRKLGSSENAAERNT